MITNMVNDFLGAAKAIGDADPNTQIVLFLLLFVALPWALMYIRSLFVGSARNIVGGDMVGGDKITHGDDDDEDGVYAYEFPRPSATATIMMVCPSTREFFVGYRSEDAEAFPGYACLPGGFLDAKVVRGKKVIRPGERIEQTAVRETEEETGVTINERDLILLDVQSDPNDDPRTHVINVCYLVLVEGDQYSDAHAADDLEDYDWRSLDHVDTERAYAFRHYDIIRKGKDMFERMQANKEVKQ